MTDRTIDRKLAEARRAWPAFDVTTQRFRDVVTRAVSAGEATVEDFHASDLYLALACLDGVPLALAAFDRTVLAPVRPSVARACAGAADADDAVQTTLEKLLVGSEPKLAQYVGRGPLVGWVRVVAVRTALEARRKDHRHGPAGIELVAEASPSIDLVLLRERHGEAFRSAVQEALRRLDAEQRTLLRMHTHDKLSIDRIAPMLGVHRATAARRLDRARADALAHTRAILAEREGLSKSEARSLCIALARDVDVSIGRALGDEARR